MRNLPTLIAALALATTVAAQAPEPKPQPRPHGIRVPVDRASIEIDDGDSLLVRWTKDDLETVRILAIDTPETCHLEHNLPYAKPFGPEARTFAMGAFALATKVELLRAKTLDAYGGTLGYVFLNGRNDCVLVVSARLEETVGRYGDNGFPGEAAEVTAAAKAGGPLPFESPAAYRGRMRDVTKWMKQYGQYPEQ
jgi:hypothetical protein